MLFGDACVSVCVRETEREEGGGGRLLADFTD